MNQDRQVIIYFNNGTTMELSFPVQIKNSMGALVELGKRIIESDKLIIQTDEKVLIIPWSSVKYVDASAISGAALPLGAIKGARILDAGGTKANLDKSEKSDSL